MSQIFLYVYSIVQLDMIRQVMSQQRHNKIIVYESDIVALLRIDLPLQVYPLLNSNNQKDYSLSIAICTLATSYC